MTINSHTDMSSGLLVQNIARVRSTLCQVTNITVKAVYQVIFEKTAQRVNNFS